MRFYRALLRAYPTSFRAEYGEELAAVFGCRLRDARGAAQRMAFWLSAIGDVLVNAARVHADILRQDVRYTARALRRSPGFAGTAILIAALGVGAVTAAFSLADHVLFRPLPYPDADRLVYIWQDDSVEGYTRNEPSPPNYRDWKRSSRSFEAMGAYAFLSANLLGAGRPQHLEGVAVDADLLPILRVAPLLGRGLTNEDHAPNAPGSLLLSETAWRTRFGGDASVVGRKVLLDGTPFTVVGVLPRAFRFPTRETEFWTPLRMNDDDANDRSNNFLKVLAKRRPDVPLESARAEMRAIGAALRREFPKENARVGVSVVPLRDEFPARRRLMLIALLGASASVLLIACTNLANLLLARALSRGHELSVRTALGAGRERLVRQLMTESAVLAFCGGALGVALAVAALPLLARLVPSVLPISEQPAVDLRMLGFASLLTALTGVGFGVIPALRLGRDAAGAGRRGGARTGADRRTEGLRSLLVVAELALSVALLVPAGLFLRALWRIQSQDPGFRPQSVLTLHTSLPIPEYAPTERRARFYERVLEEVRSRPGVAAAGYISFLPMVTTGMIWGVTPEGEPEDPAHSRSVSLRFVTPGFFGTLGIPLRLGRDVEASDTTKSPLVAVVSDSFAQQIWPGRTPLGMRFRVAGLDRTVVGVVGDVRVRGLEQESEPQLYLPYRQVEDGAIIGYAPKELVVRSTEAPGTLAPAIREIVDRADPRIPVSNVRVLSDIVQADTAPRRLQARVLGAFAAVAVALAGIGIHGLLAFTVSRRFREIGVRVALGAEAGDILRLVLGRAARLCAAGVGLGLVAAYAIGRGLQSLLAGIPPGDLTTFAAATALAAAAMLAGSFVPALRAARVDPLTVLRAE